MSMKEDIKGLRGVVTGLADHGIIVSIGFAFTAPIISVIAILINIKRLLVG